MADPGGDRGDHPPPLNLSRMSKSEGVFQFFGVWMTSRGQCPRGVLVNVQEWGCFSIFRRVDDVTRTMSKGVCACECLHPPPPSRNHVSAPEMDPPLSKILDPHLGHAHSVSHLETHHHLLFFAHGPCQRSRGRDYVYILTLLVRFTTAISL